MLTFAARSNLVRRSFSILGRAAWRKTIARSRANPTRKRVFGGAWPPSSPVRRSTRARPCLLAHAECVLLERAAGPLSRCPSAQHRLPAAIDTYGSSCARLSAGMWPPEGAARSASSPRVRCMCLSWRTICMTRSVPVLGCTWESVRDLGCSERAWVVFFHVVTMA